MYQFLKLKYQKVSLRDKGFLYFTLITIFFIGLFIPVRWIEGEMDLVVTNMIIVAMSAFVHILLVSGYSNLSRQIYVGFIFVMMIHMIYQNGAAQLSWVSPAGAMLFLSLRPKIALSACSLLVVIIGILIWEELIFSQWLQAVVSLFSTGIIVFIYCLKVDQHEEYLNSKSMIDEMSGLNNRRSFDHDIEHLKTHENKRHYLLILDVDHFKKINDNYGHDVGDEVIKHVSKTLKDSLRDDEKIYRVGGEEFAVIISANSNQSAAECAERLRLLTESSDFITSEGVHLSYTISVGVSEYVEDALKWFRQADKALYRAKDAGRNNVQFTSED